MGRRVQAETKPTVLIVEDEPLVREIAVEEFEEAGFRVVTAADDRTALSILESPQPIGLLFTDIRILGVLDGWVIADRARRVRPDLPVIYATGFSAEQMRMVEGSLFFKKPYRVATIIAAARSLGVAVGG